MGEKVNEKIIYSCKICNKNYSSQSSLCNHNKKFHDVNNQPLSTNNQLLSTNNQPIINQNKYTCRYCNKIYNILQSRWKHEQKCKDNNNKDKELELEKIKLQVAKEETKILQLKLTDQKNIILKEENEKLKEELKKININKIKQDINDIKNNINNPPINNQLINIISDKNKKIEELHKNQLIIKPITEPIIEPIIEKHINTFESLTLNNIVITSRSDDNFINATQLCQAGGKLFADWYRLNATKELINEASSDMGIPISQLVDLKKGNSCEFIQGTWIHPDLAIQLAQWISPKFAIQVSKWIRQLFTNGKVEINTQLITENKLKDKKIKLLENTYLKKHKRINYPDKNVIYILSTDDHLKNRTYIIGKAINLKTRLSTYNKTCEHQVIYYKKCINEETLNLVELNVLNKLKQYQEKANRDRFILPIENDISLFTNIIDNCVNFLNNNI